MSKQALQEKKTNHSLRVAGATTLFDAGVPEHIIQQRTGHKSVWGLRIYERVNEGQEKMVSKILSGESKKFDESAVKYGDENHETKQNSTLGFDTKPRSALGEVMNVASLQPSTAPQYNNCNINYYSSPTPYPYGQAFPSHHVGIVLLSVQTTPNRLILTLISIEPPPPTTAASGVQYNNCTVNVYSAPAVQAPSFYPVPTFPYTPPVFHCYECSSTYNLPPTSQDMYN